MGGDQYLFIPPQGMIFRQRLRRGHFQSDTPKMIPVQQFTQSLLIDQTSPSAVDQHRVLLHQTQPPPIQQMHSFRGVGQGADNNIRPGQILVQLIKGDHVVIASGIFPWQSTHTYDFSHHRPHPLRHRSADVSGTQNQQIGSFQLLVIFQQLPFSLMLLIPVFRQPPAQGQHHAHQMLRQNIPIPSGHAAEHGPFGEDPALDIVVHPGGGALHPR